MSECVQVCVRCRPLNSMERDFKNVVAVDREKGIVQLAAVEEKRPYAFTFDHAYPDNITQKEIYEDVGRAIVDGVMTGYNGTIFAYGQTGTGKTFTMMGEGSGDLQGITPRAFHHIFDQIAASTEGFTFLVRCSFVEIYQEKIRDLLSSRNEKLKISERPDSGVFISGLIEQEVDTVEKMLKYLAFGNKRRTTGATAMNDQSSRSHSVFSVVVESSHITESGKDKFRVGKLRLVDLAGSESQKKTQASGVRLNEAKFINGSLMVLGRVIESLTSKDISYVPYRSSKLTHILKDSLGGNAKTAIIANIGPSESNHSETLSTLRFASRAKKIENKPTINEDPKDALLREYSLEIAALKKKLKDQTNVDQGVEVVQKITEKKIYKQGVSKREVERLRAQVQQEQEALKQQHAARVGKIQESIRKDLLKQEKAEESLQKYQNKLRDAETNLEILQSKAKAIDHKLAAGSRILEEAEKQDERLKKKTEELIIQTKDAEHMGKILSQRNEEHKMLKTKFKNQADELASRKRKLEVTSILLSVEF